MYYNSQGFSIAVGLLPAKTRRYKMKTWDVPPIRNANLSLEIPN